MSTPAIRIENLAKIYPRGWRLPAKNALKGVSLSVDAGETFGFIGPNGAGKSTLIKILVGVLRPSSGQALLFGRSAAEARSRFRLGFVPENPSLQEFLTPYEVLLMGLRFHGVHVADERAHCMRWLERFELSSVANAPIRGFSKGMTQRTALAHALSIKPRLLILDEPLSGLDPVGRKDVVDILDDYRKEGGTLFFSSHVLYDVERIADRFGLIHQGALMTIRSPRDIAVDQADQYVLRYRGDVAIYAAVEERPGVFVADIAGHELAALIQTVQLSGGIIQDVRPKVSLETVFFRTINAAQGEKV